MAKRRIEPKQLKLALTGSGVVDANDVNDIWLFLPLTVEEFNRIRGDIVKIYNTSERKIKIKLYGVEIDSYLPSTTKIQEMELAVQNMLRKQLNGKLIRYECYGVEEDQGVLCAITLDGVDINEALMKQGVTRYAHTAAELSMGPWRNDAYLNAEAQAKDAEIGVWNAFYDMFGDVKVGGTKRK
jgi:endonuclease YncB( thermonuclease family)